MPTDLQAALTPFKVPCWACLKTGRDGDPCIQGKGDCRKLRSTDVIALVEAFRSHADALAAALAEAESRISLMHKEIVEEQREKPAGDESRFWLHKGYELGLRNAHAAVHHLKAAYDAALAKAIRTPAPAEGK